MPFAFAIFLILVPASDGLLYWQFDHAEKVSPETCRALEAVGMTGRKQVRCVYGKKP